MFIFCSLFIKLKNKKIEKNEKIKNRKVTKLEKMWKCGKLLKQGFSLEIKEKVRIL